MHEAIKTLQCGNRYVNARKYNCTQKRSTTTECLPHARSTGSSSKSGISKSSNSGEQQLLLHRCSTRPADTAAFRWRVIVERNPTVASAAGSAAAYSDGGGGSAGAAATAAAVVAEDEERASISSRRQETQAEAQAELLQQVERASRDKSQQKGQVANTAAAY